MTAVAGIVQPTLEKGDHLVICGDSITFHSVALPFGFHHQLTNVFAKTCPEKGLTVSSLGFSGYQVGSWIDLDRKSRTQKVWTHFKHPGWNVSDVLSNKVDAVAVFLGMNDILMPSMDGSEKSVDAWGARLKRLVRALREHTGAKKFVLCTTTPLTADPASPKNIVRLEIGDLWRVDPGAGAVSLSSYVGGDRLSDGAPICQPWASEMRTVRGNGRICNRDISRAWQDRLDVPVARNERPTGAWNWVTIVCLGDHVTTVLNGRPVNFGFNVRPTRGRIQLQSEGNAVEFRQVLLTPLARSANWAKSGMRLHENG